MLNAALLPEFPMEYLKFVWIIIFFFFSLCLIFIWSKILVIVKRTSAITELLKSFNVLSAENEPNDRKASAE